MRANGDYVGRGAPEIDIFEATIERGVGKVSMSSQWAPFNVGRKSKPRDQYGRLMNDLHRRNILGKTLPITLYSMTEIVPILMNIKAVRAQALCKDNG